MTATRTAYLSALRTAIEGQGYAWATPEKVTSFMDKVQKTIETPRNVVCIDSPSFVQAWRAIGMKGKPTYKGLRALPV